MERKNKKKPDWPLFHSHPAGRRPRTVRFNITRRKIRPLSVWTWPRGVFPSAYSVASVYNRRTCNSVRRVTCVTLPWPIPGLVSAAQRKESTTGLRDASPRDWEKKKKKKHPPVTAEKNRERTALFPIVNLSSSPQQPQWVRLSIRRSARYGCEAGLSPPLWELHILLQALRPFKCSQTACKSESSRNHADRTECFLSFFLHFFLTGPFLIIHRPHACKLPPTRAWRN